jgi:hypothetical protein
MDKLLKANALPAYFALRILWVVIRVYLVIYLGQPGVKFFYQGF